MAFNIIAMFLVITPDEQRLRFAGAMIVDCPVMPPPPAAYGALSRQARQYEGKNINHNRAFNTHSVILLGFRPVVRHVFGGVINAADEGDAIVNDHNFAMHPAKQIGAHPEQTWARIVITENNTRRG